jgi:hypothetical protein
MSRFDNLKDNFVSSNTNKKEIRHKMSEYNDRRDHNRMDHNRMDHNRRYGVRKNNNIFKEKMKTEFSICKENFPILKSDVIYNIQKKPEKEESNWLKAVETQNTLLVKDDIFIIDSNKSKYWKGAQWAGPVMSRHQTLEKTKNEKRNTENLSTGIIPSLGIEYSIDGKHWHINRNDTFSQQQLCAMDDEENNNLIQRWCNWIDYTHHKQKVESEQYFYETGEMDGFAIAESNMIDYETYAEQFNANKDDIELELDEDDDDDDDYLEDN